MTNTLRRLLTALAILSCMILYVILVRVDNMVMGMPLAVMSFSLATIAKLHP